MLDIEDIKQLLSSQSIVPREKLLICLAREPLRAWSVKELRALAVGLGLRAAKDWNLSSYLTKLGEFAIRGNEGWEISTLGKTRVSEVVGPILPSVSRLVVSALRKQIPQISNLATQVFVEEAVKALEAKLYRSAIVLSWVGAIALLYDHVVTSHLAQFNLEANRRDSRWKLALNPDDLARMKEHEFLHVISAISIIGKNVKDELEVCLKLRNGCGHPNSLIVGEHKASAHVETLILNVYSKF